MKQKCKKGTVSGKKSRFLAVAVGEPGGLSRRLYFLETTKKRGPHVQHAQFGAFDDVTSADYDEEKVLMAIEHRLANIYSDVIKTKIIYYRYTEPLPLTRLSDGRLYLKYHFYLDIYTGKGSKVFEEHTNLLVCIG